MTNNEPSTWTLNQETGEWGGGRTIRGAAYNPPAHQSTVMVYDASRQRMVAFQNTDTNDDRVDIWELPDDTYQWVSIGHAEGPLTLTRAVYDEATSEVFILDEEGGMWQWTGTSWIDRRPLVGPSPDLTASGFNDGVLIYNSNRRRIMFVRLMPDETNGFLFLEWAGDRWESMQVDTSVLPTQRVNVQMAYDSRRDEYIAYGGRRVELVSGGRTSPLNDTWAMKPPGRPAIQWRVAIPRQIEKKDVQDIEIHTYCGGASTTSGMAASGAETLLWSVGGPGRFNRDDWYAIGQSSVGVDMGSSASTSAFVDWRSTSALEAQTLIAHDNTINLQCRSLGDSGGGYATTALDYAEVRVRYENQ